jgi:hypothetical protein
MNAAPATTSSKPNLLTSVLNVLSPFAGNSPTAPAGNSPVALLLAGAARREVGIESFTSQALLAPADSITYAPVITLLEPGDNGVITGRNNPTQINGNPVTYTVVSDPSGGGKVLLNPATGDFNFLPDFSSVVSALSKAGLTWDDIAVIEIMTGELDRPFWRSLRERLEDELSQEEIVIRAQEIILF